MAKKTITCTFVIKKLAKVYDIKIKFDRSFLRGFGDSSSSTETIYDD